MIDDTKDKVRKNLMIFSSTIIGAEFLGIDIEKIPMFFSEKIQSTFKVINHWNDSAKMR